MNNLAITQVWRFIGLLLAQILIFKQIQFIDEGWRYLHIFVYPLFIFLLPIKLQNTIVLILAFFMGLLVDWFYDSPGVHASALVFMAYIRPFVLGILEPYEGYNMNDSPNLHKLGLGWFTSYISILLFCYLFFYFSVEAFSFVFIFDIVMNTLVTFVGSIFVIILIQFLFRSR
ncbi:MAG: hypothetical protein WAT79_07100 [Saprospiraceae bacterium]